jgi:hypothetical protein
MNKLATGDSLMPGWRTKKDPEAKFKTNEGSGSEQVISSSGSGGSRPIDQLRSHIFPPSIGRHSK